MSRMRSLIKIAIISLSIGIICATAQGASYIYGTLEKGVNDHWGVGGNLSSPVNIVGDVTVPSGDTLLVEPGTVIRFAANMDYCQSGYDTTKSEIIIRGTIIANGQAGSEILFRSSATNPVENEWQCIYMRSSGSKAIFNYCSFKHARHGIFIPWDSCVEVNHCSFSELSVGIRQRHGFAYVSYSVFGDTLIPISYCVDGFYGGYFFSSWNIFQNYTFKGVCVCDGDFGGGATGSPGMNQFLRNPQCCNADLANVNQGGEEDTIKAENNWWGHDPPEHIYGLVDYDPWLHEPPEVGIPNSSVTSSVPGDYLLAQNYPNPFNSVTTISFKVLTGGHVQLAVYNINGQLLKTLIDGNMDVGLHTIYWDGKDSSGKRAASGVYFYELKVNDFIQAKKLMLLK